MSPASKETCVPGNSRLQRCAQPLAQRFAAGSVRLQRHLNDGILRSAGEQVDQVHGIAGRDRAHEIAGDPDVVLAGLALDHVQRVQHDALGLLDARAGRSAQADAQQRRVGVGEQFGSDARQQKIQQSRRRKPDRRSPAASGTAGHRADSVRRRSGDGRRVLRAPRRDAPPASARWKTPAPGCWTAGRTRSSRRPPPATAERKAAGPRRS